MRNNILKKLAEYYELIVRAEYHVQILLSNGKYHNFWPVNKYTNSIKVQLAGMQQSKIYHDADKLIATLRSFNYDSNSDYAQMKQLERLLIKIKDLRSAVYCDAGHKDGLSRLTIIRKLDSDIDIMIRQSTTYSNINQAEIAAIEIAIEKFVGYTIFSDSQTAVDNVNKRYGRELAFWIRRTENMEADLFCNLRKK